MIVRSQDGATVLDTDSVSAFIIQGSSIYAHLKASSIMPRMFDEEYHYPAGSMQINGSKKATDRLYECFIAWSRSSSAYPIQRQTVSFQF